jgi:hypothetical protein
MDPTLIFEKFMGLRRSVDASIRENSFVFTEVESEIRLKPPKNIPLSMILNQALSLGFVPQDECDIEDWKWGNLRHRKVLGRLEITRKIQTGPAFKFKTTTGWEGRVVVSTETAVNEPAPHAACEYYRKAHRKSFVTVDGAFTLDVTSNSNMTEVEIEVNHPHVQPSDLTQLVTMLCQ